MPNWARHGHRKEKRKYFALQKTRHVLSVGFTRKEVSKKADQKLTKKNRANRAFFRYQVKRIARERLFLSTRPAFRLDSSCLWPLFERNFGLPPNAGGIPQKHHIGRSNHPLRLSCDAWFEIRHDEPKRSKYFLRHCLLPRLRVDDVFALDNLRPHRQKAVRQLARAVGVEVVYLSAYSPELNPIEYV